MIDSHDKGPEMPAIQQTTRSFLLLRRLGGSVGPHSAGWYHWLAAVILISGCNCTTLGCPEALRIEVTSVEPAPGSEYELELSADGATDTFHVEISTSDYVVNLGTPSPVGAETGWRVESSAGSIRAGSLERHDCVGVRLIRDGNVLHDYAVAFEFEDVYPNGSSCGPNCPVMRSQKKVESCQ